MSNRPPWSVGQVAVVAAVLLVLLVCVGLPYYSSGAPLPCPPFCK